MKSAADLKAQSEAEVGLDPQDWDKLRDVGHRMLDDMFVYLKSLRERPVWKPVSQSSRSYFAAPIPFEAQGADGAYRDFQEHVLPYPLGNIHPRFWSWVTGTGSPGGILAEMLSAGMNSSTHAGEQAASYVEQQVLSWLKQALGFPLEASGLLVSGGSMANFVALNVARNAKAGWDVAKLGLAGKSQLVMYCSRETHSSVQKAVLALGLGSAGLRYIDADKDFRINIADLREAITDDRSAGRTPVCVIGNAGTVNSGAIDDLEQLADLCRAEKLWFHVDGAFGAIAAICPELKPLLRGMERADSLAFDLHKWMYMPYEVGCVLVRSAEDHRAAFEYQAAYLENHGRGLTSGPVWFSHYGLELSRSFRALKVWFSLKEHGLDTYRKLVLQNVAQCRYLGELVAAEPNLELLAPIPLNVVCFRYRGRMSSEEGLTAINREIVLRLQEAGTAAPSTTLIGNKFAIRVANVNHRSRRNDFELLVKEIVRLGRELEGGLTTNAASGIGRE